MRLFPIIILLLALASPVFPATEKEAGITMDAKTISKGREIFMSACNACHGLKYYRGGARREGIKPLMEPAAAKEAFGVEPPDLSLMAIARGKRTQGARYIYKLLTSYYLDKESREMRNRAFAEWTEGEGVIAMPPPFALDDPEIEEKSAQVAAFLFNVAMPERSERRRVGAYAMTYMALLTVLLFALNRLTWRNVRKKM